MRTVATDVPTTGGSRYLQQLAKHWSHKFAVDFTPEAGTIALPAATLTMAAHPDRLALTLAGEDGDAVEHLKTVVAAHLDRFAFREAPLAFDWSDRA